MRLASAFLVLTIASCKDKLPVVLEFCPVGYDCSVQGRFPNEKDCEDYRERFSSACCGGQASGYRADKCLVGRNKQGELTCELPQPYGTHDPTTFNTTRCVRR